MSRTARLIAAAGLTALLSCTAAVAVTAGPSGVGWDSVEAATAPGGVAWDSVRAAGPQGVGWDSAATDKRGVAWD
ncbi:hypothetical protein ACIPW5_12145 [Streptomyces sp. NPDC090077]|uniref:hypothetical protein n=1 Tax=Streptomyces sp. NPDC090077 TaxID=3365938 RepID=UPI0038193919